MFGLLFLMIGISTSMVPPAMTANAFNSYDNGFVKLEPYVPSGGDFVKRAMFNGGFASFVQRLFHQAAGIGHYPTTSDIMNYHDY